MWRDPEGQGRLVSLDDPGRLLASDVRATLVRDEGLRLAVKNAIDTVLPELWEPMEQFEWSHDEARFEETDPPSRWWIPSEAITAADPVGALRDHLGSIPLRWRLDIAMTLLMFVTLDAEDE